MSGGRQEGRLKLLREQVSEKENEGEGRSITTVEKNTLSGEGISSLCAKDLLQDSLATNVSFNLKGVPVCQALVAVILKRKKKEHYVVSAIAQKKWKVGWKQWIGEFSCEPFYCSREK